MVVEIRAIKMINPDPVKFADHLGEAHPELRPSRSCTIIHEEGVVERMCLSVSYPGLN